MITTHCSDEELQLFAAGQSLPEPAMIQHIESCHYCQEQVVAYRAIVAGIKEQPAVVFDFDLADTVLQQLQPVKTKTSGNNMYAFIPAVFIALLVVTSLYIFRKNFLNLSAGISSFFLLTSVLACISIIGFKAVKLYQQYQQQIKKLNFYE